MKKVLAGAAIALGLVAAPVIANAAGNLAAPPATVLALSITGANGTTENNSFDLETGKYYRLTVTSDGGAEVLFTAPDLFQNSWLNQIVVSGAEIKVQGMSFRGVEVGEQGPNEVQISFVPIRPGDYDFFLGDDTDTPAGTFHVQ